jgi:hypothetical protein
MKVKLNTFFLNKLNNCCKHFLARFTADLPGKNLFCFEAYTVVGENAVYICTSILNCGRRKRNKPETSPQLRKYGKKLDRQVKTRQS